MATIKDIARRAGVSTSTVSHALNGTRYVDPEKRRRIEQAAHELRYSPNTLASSLRRRRTLTIGVIVPDIGNFFFAAIVEGLEQILGKAGYTFILCDSSEEFARERSLLRLLAQKRVDGMIIAPSGMSDDYKGFPWEFDGPIVFIDRLPDGKIPVDAVLVDNIGGAKAGVEHLIARGHREIAIITGLPGLSTTRERFQGYHEALLANGIQYNHNLSKQGDSRLSSGHRLMLELLREQSPTAVFVVNNLMTIGAVLAIKEHGLKIPNDIAVLGFDDYNWARITDPPLSVVRQPAEQIGIHAAEILLNRIKNGPGKKRRIVRLETTLVLRESC